MKKIIIMILIIITCVSCTKKNEKESETITVWGAGAGAQKSLKIAEKLYQKSHPNFKINFVVVPAKERVTKLQTSWAAKITKGLPDIVLLENYTLPAIRQGYKNKFIALSDYVNINDYKTPFMDSYKTQDSKYLGIPNDMTAAILMYRLDIIKKAGYTEKDMSNLTWKKYLEIGETVFEKTGIHMFSFDIASGTNPELRQMYMSSKGFWFPNIADHGVSNDQNFINLYTFLLKISKSSAIYKTDSEFSSFASALAQEKVASVIGPYWVMSNLVMKNKDQSGKWRVTQPPKVSEYPGFVRSGMWGGSSWFALKSTSKKKLVTDFISKTLSSKEFYDKVLTEAHITNNYKPHHSSSVYDTKVAFFGGQKVYKEIIKSQNELNKIKPYSFGPDHTLYTTAFSNVWHDIYAGNITINDALKAVDKEVRIKTGIWKSKKEGN